MTGRVEKICCAPSLPLDVAVRPEDGVIVDVGPYRHSVIWNDTGKSAVTYCNWCGGALSRRITLRDGRKGTICAHCESFTGFVEATAEPA